MSTISQITAHVAEECGMPLKSSTPKKQHCSPPQSSSIDDFNTSFKWSLIEVMDMDGCGEQCVRDIHHLSEHSVLVSHSLFSTKTNAEQTMWMIHYFESHIPFDVQGKRDMKKILFFIQGKQVCQQAWIKVHGISQSRFYHLRNDFEVDGGAKRLSQTEHPRQPKTLKTIAWMTQYFDKIGDKRPDKHGIYLPTCLTVKKIYNIMVEDLFNCDEAAAICYSSFCTIFKSDFKNVTIPKVSFILHCRCGAQYISGMNIFCALKLCCYKFSYFSA